MYRSSVDGYWHTTTDENIALQEATGYPVGELQNIEQMGDSECIENGELRALFIPSPEEDDEPEEAVTAVRNARSLLVDFETESTEIRHGSIEHTIHELENAKRALPDEY